MKPWYPSNGTEGLCFEEEFCMRCVRDALYSEDRPEDGCGILANAQAGEVPEWVEDEDGPRCTAFEPVDGKEHRERAEG